MSQRGHLTIVTAPAAEPITTAEAKSHLKVDAADEDTYIDTLIAEARGWVEELSGRALITQTWDLALRGFPKSREIVLPRAPLQSVTSVTYYDEDLSTSTVFSSSNYQVDTLRTPGVIRLKHDVFWPTDTLRESSGVVVRFLAGYGASGSSVPATLKHAIKLRLADLYVNREPEMAGTVVARFSNTAERLIAPFRVEWPI